MLHKFRRNDLIIALDTESGGVHVLNELTSDIIDLFHDKETENISANFAEKAYTGELSEDITAALMSLQTKGYSFSEIEEAYNELCELYSQNALYSKPILLEQKTATIPVKALCLHIAHDCNMRCRYCFASQGDFGRSKSVMSLEVGKKAIDFLVSRSGKIRNLEVDFFGGEPLLAMDTVKGIVEYARSLESKHGKCFRFTITTNGTLLDDETIDYINNEMSNVVLSIDGRKDINDKTRYFEDGSGCYDMIMPKYQKLVEKRKELGKYTDYYVRGTFTKQNLDFSNDVMHLADCGFDQISVEPVVTKDEYLSLTENETDRIFAEYDILCDKIIESRKNGKWFNFFHFMADLDEGPCLYKRTKGCGSGSEYLAITPTGDIYPCHQFVEHEEFCLGSVMDNSLNDEIRFRFKECNIGNGSLKKCADCWDKYFCGGGCAANNYKYTGKISEPYEMGCVLQKKRTECTLYMKCVEALAQEN